MPVQKKSTKPVASKTATKAKVQAPVTVVAPVATTVAVTATTVAPATVAPATVAPATVAPAKVYPSFDSLIETCVTQAQAQIVSDRALVSAIRDARKAHDRELRDANKNNKRRKQKTGGAKKPLTGFAKPCRISDELADFLCNVAGNSDIARGAEMSRTEVTRRLNEYFVKNNLRDEADKRTILYQKDPQLVKLLGGGIPQGQKLTYFNLQSALKDKFVKPAPTVQTTATATQTA